MLSAIKHLLSALCLTIAYGVAVGQVANKPAGSNLPPAPDSVHVESAYSSGSLVNFVRTRIPNQPLSDSAINSYGFFSQPVNNMKLITEYYDGLGRKVQTVDFRGIIGAEGYLDLISPVCYDPFGRETYKYLSFDSYGTMGQMVRDLVPSSFFSMLRNEHPGEQVFYGKVEYEPSPLNRVIKEMAPGNSWAGKGRGTSYLYKVNATEDSVYIWHIAHDSLAYTSADVSVNIPSVAGYYGPGQLRKNIVINEMGNAIVEYLDKDGKTILKKVQVDSTVAADFSGYSGWLCTYYVYDDLELLRFVMQPKAVTAYKQLLSFSTVNLDEACFRYEYDSRNRTIAKKVPGAGWVYMVYDKRDRLIFSQDANMRSRNQWFATLYDDINRPVTTGMISYTGNRQQLQQYVDQQSFQTTTVNVGVPAPLSLVVSDRVSSVSSYKGGEDVTFTGEFESEPTAEFVALIDTTQTTETLTVSNNPLPAGNNFVALTVSYYDNYVWNSGSNKQFVIDGISKLNNTSVGSYLDPVTAAAGTLAAGLLTGSKVRVLMDPNNLAKGNWLTTVNFYDEKGRIIETQADNYKGGIDLTLTRYTFHDVPSLIYQKHKNPASSGTPITTLTGKPYNYLGQQTDLRQEINDSGGMSSIASYLYDVGNRIQRKMFWKAPGSSDYAYNLRGGMRGINEYYVDPAIPPDYFGLDPYSIWFGEIVNYDNGFEKTQYNGNIAGVKWKSKGDGEMRSYGFSYDKSDRLMSADFNQLFGATWAKSDPGSTNYNYDFSVQMGDGLNPATAYDENGNIRSMKQWGLKLNNSSVIDDLTYNYSTGTNKLLNVIDAANDTATKLGDFRTSGLHPVQNKTNTTVDYTYDSNGNLLKDLNKDIGNSSVAGIEYNHLNLPYKIAVYNQSGVKGTITYIYDAQGNKLEKRVTEIGQPDSWTSYLGRFQYQNDSLEFFTHDEGRVRAKRSTVNNEPKTAYIYDYFVKDHLGNVRMVLTEEKQQDIYPIASLENANDVALSGQYYTVNNGNIADKSAALAIPDYPNNNGIPTNNNAVNPGDNSQKLYRLNGTANATKMGLGITLKVMAGDTVSIFGKSYWKTAAGPNVPGQPNTIALLDLLTAFVGSALPGAKAGVSGNDLNGVPEITGALTSLLNGQGQTSTIPKAYINWVLFDENFHPVINGTNSGFDQVDSAGKLKTHSKTTGVIKKGGYLFIYCSNESQVDVFFDNLQVVHSRGPLSEETHYYPFGLTMAGISSKVLKGNYAENKRKFVGQSFDDDLGWNMYQFRYRTHDPQIGRFIQIDPLANKYVYNSTYAYAEDKPTNGIDLEGLELMPSPLLPLFESNSIVPKGPVVEDIVKPLVENGNKLPKTEEHHYIPRELKTDEVVKSARDGGFKFEGAENKGSIEKFSKATGEGQHGNHPNYTSEVARRITDFQKENPGASAEEAAEFLRNTVRDLKETIRQNPTTKLNDLFKAAQQPIMKDGILQGLPKPGSIGPPDKPEKPYPCPQCVM